MQPIHTLGHLGPRISIAQIRKSEAIQSKNGQGPSVAKIQPREQCVESLLQEFVGILEVELDQYRDISCLLRAQREGFALTHFRSFEDGRKRQETVVLRIKTIEEARKSIVTRLSKHFDISRDEFNLPRLATLVDGPYSEQCWTYQEEILSLIRELEDLRESNAYLIQHALHYVSGVLRIFASASATDFACLGNG